MSPGNSPPRSSRTNTGRFRYPTAFRLCIQREATQNPLGPVNTIWIIVAGGHFFGQRGGRREA
ncbi:MAG: hypothetical protein VR73_14145 [Gammaproteobacteria bacterium BRH_c0]|nr:MAG: hypothetical protein VR73_14145 [Gammaproteobacteria bacterium BRH_c0]